MSEPTPDPSALPVPVKPWPPDWARSVAFLIGCGMVAFEAVAEHSAHLFVYPVGFAFTGLPLARGLEKLLDLFGKK